MKKILFLHDLNNFNENFRKNVTYDNIKSQKKSKVSLSPSLSLSLSLSLLTPTPYPIPPLPTFLKFKRDVKKVSSQVFSGKGIV